MKKYKFTILAVLILVLPSILYLIVNFYWWLFNGNNLDGDKMLGALTAVTLAIPITYLAYIVDGGASL